MPTQIIQVTQDMLKGGILGLAKQYGMDLPTFQRLNPSIYSLKLGQQIKINQLTPGTYAGKSVGLSNKPMGSLGGVFGSQNTPKPGLTSTEYSKALVSYGKKKDIFSGSYNKFADFLPSMQSQTGYAPKSLTVPSGFVESMQSQYEKVKAQQMESMKVPIVKEFQVNPNKGDASKAPILKPHHDKQFTQMDSSWKTWESYSPEYKQHLEDIDSLFYSFSLGEIPGMPDISNYDAKRYLQYIQMLNPGEYDSYTVNQFMTELGFKMSDVNEGGGAETANWVFDPNAAFGANTEGEGGEGGTGDGGWDWNSIFGGGGGGSYAPEKIVIDPAGGFTLTNWRIGTG